MPKKHQNDPRSAQKRPQNDPKTTKKAIPNDKTTREPNQDDFKTVLDPPKGPEHRFVRTLGGSFGRPNRHQNGTKNDPKSKQKIKSQKNRSKTILDRLGAILGRLGPPSWAKKRLKPFILNGFVKNHFFADESIRRRSWDQLWPTRAPK